MEDGLMMNMNDLYKPLEYLVKIGAKYINMSVLAPVHRRDLMHKSILIS